MRLSPKKGPFRLSLGDRGEMCAWDFLRRQGYQILEKNYRCPLGEIDVVAEKDGRTIFVEIKTRAHPGFGRPEEAVHEIKQRKLVRIAQWYLKERRRSDGPAAFHVLAVTWRQDAAPEIRLIENAFGVDNARNG